MLLNIKSSYFIKIIFTYIAEGNKLKLIKYNKNLQKEMNITIINYKFFTGKYIIYETNKIGKEYDCCDDSLTFEGEYFHGERHGKGKEYYNLNDILKFEGEYLYGKRNGNGKEYNFDGRLKFEGGYLNGERNRKGKDYNSEKL